MISNKANYPVCIEEALTSIGIPSKLVCVLLTTNVHVFLFLPPPCLLSAVLPS